MQRFDIILIFATLALSTSVFFQNCSQNTFDNPSQANTATTELKR